ncbi:MAG: DoxX family protein [Cyclobacteriaceae bacterium]|jgi:putative oxidoreductase|nr:DoxX family protein [Cyclobacteriaceae bacterium]MDH4295166.1 DoxX family protein [Cyclobacteriaceae bacterium]MDH5250831.1 DoxX family protein [Cyclobacteriaceae bacterium]
MKTLFSVSPIWQNEAMGVIRIVLGLLIIYHGQEVFNESLMKEYLAWDTFKGPNGEMMLYFGKSSELIAGIFLLLGLFTRIGALLIIGTLLFVTFFVGSGRFWYEDQHPFMFVILGLVYFFNGPGAWSLDKLIFGAREDIS